MISRLWSLLGAPSTREEPEDEDMSDGEIDDAAPAADTTLRLTPAEINKRVAEIIDEEYAARHENEQDAKLKDPTRKFRWNIDISPDQEPWKEARKRFQQALKKDSVLAVLEREFEEPQKLYLIPPKVNGTILKIQNEHTELYNASFKEGAKFHGIPDNLATKLTMLHFCLPIAPLTMNNIMNCGKNTDVTDPEDKPEDLPKLQRIMYAEKPLEFLDKYHERSYGFPILRRPKFKYQPPARPSFAASTARLNTTPAVPSMQPLSATQPAAGFAIATAESSNTPPPANSASPTGWGPSNQPPDKSSGTNTVAKAPLVHHNPSIFPTSNKVGMRGGAGRADRSEKSHLGQSHEPGASGLFRANPGGILRTTTPRRGRANPKHARFYKDTPTHSTDEEDHMIYGYSGRLIHKFKGKNDVLDRLGFKNIVLRLAGYHEQSDWEFCIDIPGHGTNAARTVTMKDSNYDENYDRFIKPYLTDESSWKLFVRRPTLDKENAAGELKPSSLAEHNVVELHLKNAGSAYLEVPENFQDDQEYGVNQIQKHFFPAIKLLFRDRPLGEIKIDDKSLGYGGFEITTEIWENIRSGCKDGSRVFEVQEIPENKGIGYVRLIGSPKEMKYTESDFKQVENGIRSQIKEIAAPGYRIWESPERRERDGRSLLVDILGARQSVERDLENFFEKPGHITNAPFRPEWRTFTIIEIVKGNTPPSATWEPKHGEETLDNFRDFLKQSFHNDSVDYDNVILHEARDVVEDGRREGRKYSIDRSTSEEEWRMNVFDWLQTSKIRVALGKAHTYQLDESHHWGKFEASYVGAANKATRKEQDKIAEEQRKQNKQSGSSDQTTLPSLFTLSSSQNTAPKPTRFNKPRYEAETAGRAPCIEWTQWQAEEREKDKLHRDSYHTDQGVIVPGRAPAAPIFGESIQLQHRISDAVPTIYLARTTPTDLRQIQEERQALRNHVLDRQWKCIICSVEFAHYQKEEIADHITEHQAREKLEGVCVWCGDNQWGFWSTAKKQTHLRQHLEKENTLKMKDFWDAHDCPACNKTFKDMRPEDIVAHCINQHSPWTVPFCDKCGLNEYDCTELHRSHHEKTCRQRPDEPEGSRSHEFCVKCGKDTSLQTPVEYNLHQRDCHPGRKWFCQVCGFDITGFSGPAVHAHHAACKPPGGRKKSWCRKCGQRVGGISRRDWHYHDQTCWKSIDPAPENIRSQLEDLQKQKEAIAQLNAQWTSKQDYVRRRTEEFEKEQASFEEQKKSLERSKIANQELQDRLEEQLSNESIAQHGLLVFEPQNFGKCSFHGCLANVGLMNRRQFYNHFAHHARETEASAQAATNSSDRVKFSCPLEKATGGVCSQTLDPSDSAFFGTHLVHKSGPSEQRQVDTVLAAGTNREMREAMKNLRDVMELDKGLPEPSSSIHQPQDDHHHIRNGGRTASAKATLSLTRGSTTGPHLRPRRPTTTHQPPTTSHGGALAQPIHHRPSKPSKPSKPSNQLPSKPSTRVSGQHPSFSTGGEAIAASSSSKGKEKATSGDREPVTIRSKNGVTENAREETFEFETKVARSARKRRRKHGNATSGTNIEQAAAEIYETEEASLSKRRKVKTKK